MKLQWRPDWAARWTALGVDYEMSGKDLVDSIRVSEKVARVLGGEPPETPHFELFMDENNQKISKSKGNGLTMEDWLRYGAPESLAYYMFGSPQSAKRLYFDVIPKATDEYLQQLDAYQPRRGGSNAANPLDNPVWSVHGGAAAGEGLAGVVHPAAQSGLGGQRLRQGDPLGLSQPPSAGRDAGERAAARPAGRLRDQLLRGLRAAGEEVPPGRRSASGPPSPTSKRA